MEIEKTQLGEVLEFKITGRLDAYWSDHLSSEITSAIRSGAHQIRLDLSGVQYISSAGIRVLLNFYQQLKAIQGTLFVTNCSDQAKSVLQMAGLLELLSATEASTWCVSTEKIGGRLPSRATTRASLPTANERSTSSNGKDASAALKWTARMTSCSTRRRT